MRIFCTSFVGCRQSLKNLSTKLCDVDRAIGTCRNRGGTGGACPPPPPPPPFCHCMVISLGLDILILLYASSSLVARPYPAVQCCTLKNGRAWYLKSRARARLLRNKHLEKGGQTNHLVSAYGAFWLVVERLPHTRIPSVWPCHLPVASASCPK